MQMASHCPRLRHKCLRTAYHPLFPTLTCVHSSSRQIKTNPPLIAFSPHNYPCRNAQKIARTGHSGVRGGARYLCLFICQCAPTQLEQVSTDHMLYIDFTPERGWSAPQIKPYGPLSLDPASSCFRYCPNVFEGMKVRLLRPPPGPSIMSKRFHRHIWDPMALRVSSDLT